MRGADGVHAELLEQFQPPFPDAERDGCTKGAAIVVQADAVELEVLPLSQKPVADSNRTSRMPNVATASSRTASPERTLAQARYRAENSDRGARGGGNDIPELRI